MYLKGPVKSLEVHKIYERPVNTHKQLSTDVSEFIRQVFHSPLYVYDVPLPSC